MSQKFHRSLFSAISILVGVFLSFALLATVEFFFRANAKYGWIQPFPPKTFDRKHPVFLPPEIETDYIKALSPYPPRADFKEPDDYEEAYRFQECPDARQHLDPYWIGAKNCKTRVILKKMFSRNPVYDVSLDFDENALRIIPSADKSKDPFLLFLGCSFTFGEGVEGDEMFVNLITKKLGPINAFNLATNGYGPHLTNALFRKGPGDIRLQAIHGSQGIATYTYIDDHFVRIMGTMNYIGRSPNIQYEPYYHLEGGKLIYAGSFINTRYFRTVVYSWLAKSAMIKFFQIEYPRPNSEDIKLFVATIVDLKENLFKNYNIKKFIFSVFPDNFLYVDQLTPLLEKEGIDVFNFSNVGAQDIFHDRLYLNGNGHPSPEAHRFYADLFTLEFNRRGLGVYLK